MLFRLIAVLVVLALVPVATAGADPGSSPTGDAAQSQYGGTPPQPVPQPEDDVEADDEQGQDDAGAGDEEPSGQGDGGDLEGTDDDTGAAGGPGDGSGATPDEVAAEVRDVAGAARQGGTLPFTGSAALLGLGAGALLVTAGLATRRLGRTA